MVPKNGQDFLDTQLYKYLNIIVALDLQVEGALERNIFLGHRLNVNLLQEAAARHYLLSEQWPWLRY